MKKILNILFILLFFAINLFAQNKQQQTYYPKGDSIEFRLIPGTTPMYTAEQTDETFVDNETTIAIKLVSSDNPTGTTKTNKIVDNPMFTIETPVNPNWKETNPLHRGFIQNKPKTIEESGITNAVDINTFISFKTNTEGKINIITNNIRIINENIINATNTLYLTVSNEISNVSEDLHNNYYDIDTITNNYYDITDITDLLSTNVWQDDLGHGQYSITINDLPFLTIDVNAKENVTTNLDIPTSLNELLDVSLEDKIDDGQLLTYSSDDSLWVAKNLPQSDWEANEDEVIFIKNKPKINTTNETSQNILTNEIIIGTIELHKISSTGDYDDLLHRPYLVTTNLESLEVNEHELLSGDIQFHKISKTGAWNDLVGVPNDLARTGDIHNGIISFSTNNVLIPNQSFGVNDSNNKTIDIPMPIVNNGTLSINTNNILAGTFTANSDSNEIINLTIPTILSDLSDIDNQLSPEENQVLIYDGEQWSADYIVNSINNLTGNVEITNSGSGISIGENNGVITIANTGVTNIHFSNNSNQNTWDLKDNVNIEAGSNLLITNKNGKIVIDNTFVDNGVSTINGFNNSVIITNVEDSVIIISNSDNEEKTIYIDANLEDYATKQWVRRIEHEINSNTEITINIDTDINEQIFKRGDAENITNSIILPPATEEKTGRIMIYVEEVPSKEFHYDFANNNLDVFTDLEDDEKPWLTNTNDALWLFTFTSVQGETTWHCDTFKEYSKPYVDPTIHSFTRAVYVDGHTNDYDIVGTLSSNKIQTANLRYIEIGTNVTSIEMKTFSQCNTLNNVVIGSGVQTIGVGAFQSCTSLTSVNLPDNVTELNNQAFLKCTNLTSISIGSGIKSIGQQAFSKCTNLVHVVIPNNVTSLLYYAFSECTKLQDITIGTGVKLIDTAAFNKCSSLNAVYISDLRAWCGISFSNYAANPLSLAQHLYLNNEEIINLVIPDDIITINAYAFSEGKSIESITIPPSVTTIDANAFYNCTKVSTIYYYSTDSESRIKTLLSNSGFNISQIENWIPITP